jgi:hypothetical protein
MKKIFLALSLLLALFLFGCDVTDENPSNSTNVTTTSGVNFYNFKNIESNVVINNPTNYDSGFDIFKFIDDNYAHCFRFCEPSCRITVNECNNRVSFGCQIEVDGPTIYLNMSNGEEIGKCYSMSCYGENPETGLMERTEDCKQNCPPPSLEGC